MDPLSESPGDETDVARRFLFEQADVRGELVRLNSAYRTVIDIHQYAPGVQRLIGEFMAAAALLTATLKFDGKLILQARSEGQVPLLMAECSSRRELRAIARGAGEATSDQFNELLAGGQLVITIDPARGNRYQGIVPLLPESLAASLEGYFARSEQLTTRLWLACDGVDAAGMLLQQLPEQTVTDADQRRLDWEHASALASTVTTAELLALPAPKLLGRLYAEDELRLYDPVPLCFRCTCSRERTLQALVSLDPAEVRTLFEELGSIAMDCEFCNTQYRFLPADVPLGEEPPPNQPMH